MTLKLNGPTSAVGAKNIGGSGLMDFTHPLSRILRTRDED